MHNTFNRNPIITFSPNIVFFQTVIRIDYPRIHCRDCSMVQIVVFRVVTWGMRTSMLRRIMLLHLQGLNIKVEEMARLQKQVSRKGSLRSKRGG